MNSKNNVKNSFRGLMYNFYLDIKNLAIIGGIVSISLMVFDILMSVIFIAFTNEDVNENSGVLFLGFFVMMIAFIIYTMGQTSRSGLNSKFAFPINRKVYAISNFLQMVLGAFALLALITVLGPIELILYQILDLISDKFDYVNTFNLLNYFKGLSTSVGYIVLLSSITYLLFIYMKRYLLYSLPVISILLTTVIFLGWIPDIWFFYMAESSVIILVLKQFGVAIIAHILALPVLLKLEVN